MNDNRYAAPATVVADVEDAAVGERPRNVVIGVSLLWIQLALGIPGMVYQALNPPVEITEELVRTITLVTMAVVMIWQRRALFTAQLEVLAGKELGAHRAPGVPRPGAGDDLLGAAQTFSMSTMSGAWCTSCRRCSTLRPWCCCSRARQTPGSRRCAKRAARLVSSALEPASARCQTTVTRHPPRLSRMSSPRVESLERPRIVTIGICLLWAEIAPRDSGAGLFRLRRLKQDPRRHPRIGCMSAAWWCSSPSSRCQCSSPRCRWKGRNWARITYLVLLIFGAGDDRIRIRDELLRA